MVLSQPSIRDTIVSFFRRKFTFLLIFGFVCLAGAIYLLVATPFYLSAASLVVRFDQHTVPNIDNTQPVVQPLGSNERREIIYSDADILRSPDLLRRTIGEIGLPRLYPKIADDGHDKAKQEEEALKAFNADLVVDVGIQSDVITLSFLSPDPQVAHDTVQALLDQFSAQEANVYANPQLRFTEQETDQQRQKLAVAQQALGQFKSTHQISDFPEQIKQLIKQRADVSSRLNTAEGRVSDAEQREAALKELLSAVPQTVTTSAMGEQYRGVDEVQGQIAALKAKRDQMASTYRPGSPVFRQLDASIDSLEFGRRCAHPRCSHAWHDPDQSGLREHQDRSLAGDCGSSGSPAAGAVAGDAVEPGQPANQRPGVRRRTNMMTSTATYRSRTPHIAALPSGLRKPEWKLIATRSGFLPPL